MVLNSTGHRKKNMGIVYDAHFMYGRAYDPSRVYNDIREQTIMKERLKKSRKENAL